jgi:hypothetical protein
VAVIFYDDEVRHYCDDCEEAGRKRLIRAVLKDKERFGFRGYTKAMIKNR